MFNRTSFYKILNMKVDYVRTHYRVGVSTNNGNIVYYKIIGSGTKLYGDDQSITTITIIARGERGNELQFEELDFNNDSIGLYEVS
jgi:hypothetical protein